MHNRPNPPEVVRPTPPPRSRRLATRRPRRDRPSYEEQLADSTAAAEAAKIEACRFVGTRAVTATAILTELELELGELCPEAAGRMRAINDLAMLGIAEVVAGLPGQLQRRR